MERFTLKACPFCGLQPETNVRYWRVGDGELGLVAEVKCKCGVTKARSFQGNDEPFLTYQQMFDEVVAMWNRRA